MLSCFEILPSLYFTEDSGNYCNVTPSLDSPDCTVFLPASQAKCPETIPVRMTFASLPVGWEDRRSDTAGGSAIKAATMKA